MAFLPVRISMALGRLDEMGVVRRHNRARFGLGLGLLGFGQGRFDGLDMAFDEAIGLGVMGG